MTASTRLSTELPEPAPAPARLAENAPPELLAACTAAVPDRVSALIVGIEVASTWTPNARTSDASEIPASTSLAIRLIAIDRPIAAPRLAPLGLLPVTVMAIATPPASAVIAETSRASTRRAPDVEICERTRRASTVLVMVLPEPAPARLTVAFAPVPTTPAPPMVSAAMLTVEIASTTTPAVPSAFTMESITLARTVLVMVFTATDRPMAMLASVLDLLTDAEMANPPASTMIFDPSVAATRTAPPAVNSEPVTVAVMVAAMVLPAPAPAPANETVVPREPVEEPAASAPATASAQMVGVEVARTSTSSMAVTSAPVMSAETTEVIRLIAKATPKVAWVVPPCALTRAMAMAPASAMIAVSSVAMTATEPDEVMVPPLMAAMVVVLTMVTAPDAAPATAVPACCSWV